MDVDMGSEGDGDVDMDLGSDEDDGSHLRSMPSPAAVVAAPQAHVTLAETSRHAGG